MKKVSLILIGVIFFFESCKKKDIKEYAPFSPSVVAVDILNAPRDSVFLVSRASTLLPIQTVESKDIVTTESGRYYLKLEIDRPLKGLLVVNKQYFNVIMLPNDTTYMTLDFDNGLPDIKFQGKHQAINNYFLQKEKYLGYSDQRRPFNNFVNSKSTYSLLKRKIDSTTNVAIKFLAGYQNKYKLPAWFYELEYHEMLYGGVGFKNAIPGYNKRFKVFEDTLPDQYFKYLEGIKIDNRAAAYSPAYFRFLKGYFFHSIPKEYDELSGFPRASFVRSHILQLSKKELSGLVKEVFNKSLFSSHVKYYSDSLEVDSVAMAFEIADYSHLLENAGSKSKERMQVLNLEHGDTIPNFYVTNAIDSVVSIRDYKDKTVYINFWATWCGPCIANVPSLNQMIAEFESDERVVFLNICLESEKEKWPVTIAKHKIHGEHLFAEGNWNAKVKSYFNITGIPHYVILGQDNILEENFANRAPKVKSQIAEILN